MKNIVVIGAGTMGNGIAHTFAQTGFNVNLVDVSTEALEKGLKTITINLDRIVAKGNLTEEQKNETLNNISTFPCNPIFFKIKSFKPPIAESALV